MDPAGDPEQATARPRAAVIDLVTRAHQGYPDDGVGQWWHPARLGGTAPERDSRDD